MEKRKNYTVSVYTENNVGLLHRISAIFLKRHINIESFTTSESEIKNVQDRIDETPTGKILKDLTQSK